MDKIKSVLSGHRKSEDATQGTADSSTGQPHPIYDEMTGHPAPTAPEHDKPVELGKEGTLTESGGPYAQIQTTSGDPYVSLAKPGVMERLELAGTKAPVATADSTSAAPVGQPETATGEHLGSSSTAAATEPVADSRDAPTELHSTSQTATESHLGGSNTTTGEHVGSSHAAEAAALGTTAMATGQNVPSDGNTEISRASIKSGVIGFGPSEPNTHAALPTNYTEEQDLHPSQVAGAGTGESTTEREVQPSTESQALPHSETTTHGPQETIAADKSTEQPLDQPLRQESYTTDTNRSFPLAGGVAAKDTEAPAAHQQPSTTAQEPATKEEKSIPVIGGLVAKLTNKDKDKEHEPTHQERAAVEPETVTKEKEASPTDKEKSIPVIGGLVSKATHKDKDKDDRAVREPEPVAKEKEKEAHPAEKERSIPIVGGLLAKLTSKDKDKEHTTTHDDKAVAGSAPVVQESKKDKHAEHRDEGVALLAGGATAGVAADAAAKKHEEQAPVAHHEDPAPTQPTTSAVEPVSVTKDSSLAETDRTVPTAGAIPTTHEETTPVTKEASVVPVTRDTTSEPVQATPAELPTSTAEPEPASKESPSTEKERSIPIVGGLLARFTSKKEKDHPPAHEEKAVSEPEPAAKQTETTDTHKSVPVVGGLLSKLRSDDKEHTDTEPDKNTSEREPGTKDKEAGVHDGHGREALAGAAAAAAAASAVHASRDEKETPSATSHTVDPTPTTATDNTTMAPSSYTTSVPPASTVTDKTESNTSHHNPEALAAASAAAANAASKSSTTHEPVQTTQDRTLPSTSSTIPASQSTSTPLEVPTSQSTHQHIPGEFPDPTPEVESRSFLPTRPAAAVAPVDRSGMSTDLLDKSTSDATPTTNTVATEQDLRHTGSLEQPASKSSDLPSEHHYGRDAALVGGLAAGAAGVGHLASEKRDATETDNKPLYEESNPYSSKSLDPRVMGTSAPAAEQTIEPHHAAQTSNPVGITTATEPAATNMPTETEDSQHHLGRDAALVGGGAATASALRPSVARNDTPGTGTFVLPQETSETSAQQPLSTSAPLASSTGPVSEQPAMTGETFYDATSTPAPLADQRSEQPTSNLGPTSDLANTEPQTSSSEVPKKDNEHHLGRDAALVGAGAATAAGLSSAEHDKKETGPASKTIGPHDSNIANILDPRVQPEPSLQKDQTTTGPHKSDLLNKLDPRVNTKADQKEEQKEEKKEEHHYGRDAAIVGGTGAAAGLGAHEIAKAREEHQSTQPEASMAEPRHDTAMTGSDASHPTAIDTGAGLGTATAGPATRDATATSGQPGATTQSGPMGHQRYDSVVDPSKQHHDKRDAALLGAAGVAGAGVAEHEHSQHELQKEQEKAAKKQAHEREKEQHKQEKETHKLQKEQHKHEKEVVAMEKKHEKEQQRLEKEELKREKAEEKEQHRLEKEELKREKAEEKETRRLSKSEEGEKKGGIFGFLHRDKSKKEKTSPEDSPRRSEELAAAGTAGAVAAGTAAAHHHHEEDDPNSSKWKGKTLLHKDPPAGHPAHEAMMRQEEGQEGLVGKREHIGVDGPIGHPDLISGDRETSPGVFGAHEITDPVRSKVVIEPHTGLAMNIGKFGSGTGGTDGNTAIIGHHPVEGAGPAVGELANPAALETHPTDTGLAKDTAPAVESQHHGLGTTTGTSTDAGLVKDTNPALESHHQGLGTTTGITTGVGPEGTTTTTGHTGAEGQAI